MSKNIAVDGPAGAGKSTIAKRVAKQMNYVYVDTGAMYRALAYGVLLAKADPTAETTVVSICDSLHVSLNYEEGVQHVYLDGKDVSESIRQERVGNTASIISKYPAVRAKLLSLQKDLASKEDVIMDGRDIGTCVLPNADAKIFLTASSKVRAQRRYLELTEKGVDCDIEQIEADIVSRDEQDMNRKISPLRQAEDAILVDTSEMDMDQVVARLVEIIEEKC